jgi:hypothetical protein
VTENRYTNFRIALWAPSVFVLNWWLLCNQFSPRLATPVLLGNNLQRLVFVCQP